MASSPSFGTAPTPRRGVTLTLPPLILHPFADAAGPSRLVESSRASLKLQGLLPAGEATREELDQALLEGRYSELRMLFYVGKDLCRWIEQCLEFVTRNNERMPHGITFQSFASLLVHHAPSTVESKLRKWGVADYKSIFSRALGLQFLFADVPPRPCLADEFIRNYFRYADQLFTSKQAECEFTSVSDGDFTFELFSSGEYSRILERSWGE